ncbi:MAG TPA: hypothetical protein VLS27_03710, partial [Gammaproteobacteria bacterium]|nr:hypothetical protein [Gammaproteobacteria bacterium]
ENRITSCAETSGAMRFAYCTLRVLSVFFVGRSLLARALKVTVGDLRLAVRKLNEAVPSQIPT